VPGEYFGYYGANPVTVQEGAITTCNVQVVERGAMEVREGGAAGPATVEGTVLSPKGPVAGAGLFFYQDAARQFRGPDLFGPRGAVAGGADGNGAFSAELPPGTYYLVASKRLGGVALGPLRPGDLHGYFDGNPLTVAAGTRTSLTVQVVEKLRETSVAPAASGESTGLRGRIRDPSGAVPAGVYAYATTDPSFMIGAMPPYRSRNLDPDGSYFIALPAGGTYFVSARSGYGGPPLPGEWHGFFGEGAPAPVTVEKEKIAEGLDFTVRKME
jgi:hypothetical protein